MLDSNVMYNSVCVCACVCVCGVVWDDAAHVWAGSRIQELIPTNEELLVESVFLARYERDSVSTGSSESKKKGVEPRICMRNNGGQLSPG